MNLSELEFKNRKKILDTLSQIPAGSLQGWEMLNIAVGGLMYVGFSEVSTEKLVCISSQEQSVIDCKTGEITFCEENYDELDLIAVTDLLGDEVIHIAGLGGGGLRRYTKSGDTLRVVAPDYPKEKVIFMPQYSDCFLTPEKCTIIFDDYELIAFGFSKCGNYMVTANAHTISVFKRILSRTIQKGTEK